MTGGIPGNGVKVAYSAASPLSWTRVNQLVDFTFPTWVADKIPIDVHSVVNKLHRNMPGLISVGDPGITVLSDMDPATSPDQAFLRASNKTGASVWFRVEVPVNRARTSFFGVILSASVLSYEPATPIAGAQTTKFALTFDGDDIYEDAAVGASQIT